MIDFTNVRKEANLTYLFMTNLNIAHVRWALEESGITDYQVLSLTLMRNKLPKNITIPAFIPQHINPEKTTNQKCLHPIVLVSHMNVDDLYMKIIEIHKLHDSTPLQHINVDDNNQTETTKAS